MTDLQQDDCPTTFCLELEKDSQTEKKFTKYRNLILTECGLKITTTECYMKRLASMRKELEYIEETDWMFDATEKKTQP